MNAMVAVVQEETGGPEVLHATMIARPQLRSTDVLIQVAACGVCYHDVVVRNGTFRKRVRMPLVPGHEVAGVIVAVGGDVAGLKIGDRVCTVQRRSVCGQCRECRTGLETLCAFQEFMGDAGLNGGYAEHVAVAQDAVVVVPADVTLEQASIAACAIGTQLNAIRDVGRVKLGETVLVTGASGGQGAHGVQVARATGARVLAVTGSEAKVSAIRANGAHEVIVSPHGVDFSRAVCAATGGRGVDVVIDNVGSDIFDSIRRSLAQGGRWILVGALSGRTVPFNPAQLFLNGISMLSAVSCTRAQLHDALALIAEGIVRPVIVDRLPLDAAAEAHRRLEAGSAAGKLLLVPGISQHQHGRVARTSRVDDIDV